MGAHWLSRRKLARVEPGSRLGVIPGLVPSLFEEIRGCGFKSRCPRAMPACGEGDIPLTESDATHFDWCILPQGDRAAIWSDEIRQTKEEAVP